MIFLIEYFIISQLPNSMFCFFIERSALSENKLRRFDLRRSEKKKASYETCQSKLYTLCFCISSV